ncbi:unnamed protein product [Rotaria sordida]|uniref:MULE transposase domain-containing protein n=1 Tax=Rotaria sordida TaxID=392033 RepID=A0A819JKW3_9BILA|nr:unnamed protein product [Rotaria sordida]
MSLIKDQSIKGCNVFIHTDLNNKYLAGGKNNHEHPPNPESIQVKQIHEKIKQRVITELTPIGKIYDEEMTKTVMNSAAVAIFPVVHEMYQSAAKNRRKMVPPIPQSCLFDIPNEYKLTIEGKRFLLIDEARVRRERLLVFTSDAQMDLLFNSEVIYMDGTFKKSPSQFVQIYTINIVHFDICVPCVFSLLMNKKAATYKQIFIELKNAALKKKKVFSPSVVMTDFESGSIAAIKDEFPSAKHVCCYFHFSQSIYRKIQFLGLQQQYIIDETLRGLCRKIMALPLMPRDKILDGLDEIREAANLLPGLPMVRLLKYFDDNWMSNIDLWNVYDFDSRTNNVCEGYHNRINSRIYRHHPHIWDLINFMKAEEKRVQNIQLQWSSGASKPKNKRTTALQAQTALKGNVITFPQNVSKIARSLPLASDELSQFIKIIFVEKSLPKKDQLRSILTNILYKYIHIDHLLIDTLPINDISDCLWNTLSLVDESESQNAEHSGYINNYIDSNDLPENEIISLNTSALIDTDDGATSSIDIRRHLIRWISITNEVLASDDNIYFILHGKHPVNEYFNTAFLSEINQLTSAEIKLALSQIESNLYDYQSNSRLATLIK